MTGRSGLTFAVSTIFANPSNFVEGPEKSLENTVLFLKLPEISVKTSLAFETSDGRTFSNSLTFPAYITMISRVTVDRVHISHLICIEYILRSLYARASSLPLLGLCVSWSYKEVENVLLTSAGCVVPRLF